MKPTAGHASLRHSPALILVVDDDKVLRESLADLLRLENYAVRTACDGREAVRQFLDGPPDLILLDVNMPDINGWQAFEIMAGLYPYVAVIMITARAGQASRAASLGIDVLLEKPLDIPRLLQTIRWVLSHDEAAGFGKVLRTWRAREDERR